MKQSSNIFSPVPVKNPPVSIPKDVGTGPLGILSGSDTSLGPSDATLFSCSLPVLSHEKLNLNDTECARQSVDDSLPGLDKLDQDAEAGDILDDIEDHAVGSLLPDDEDELLAGIMDDFDLSGLPGSLEDLEDYDLFGSGGGMELEGDPQDSLGIGMSKLNLSDGVVGNGISPFALQNGAGTVAGEHPTIFRMQPIFQLAGIRMRVSPYIYNFIDLRKTFNINAVL